MFLKISNFVDKIDIGDHCGKGIKGVFKNRQKEKLSPARFSRICIQYNMKIEFELTCSNISRNSSLGIYTKITYINYKYSY